MAPILKTLPILLATATLICGATVKKSEKRGIADFSSGFSSSRLEGTGIKISTDFGKELTLEEFKQSLANQKPVDLGQDINNYNFDNSKLGNLDAFKNYNFGQQFLNKDLANPALQQTNQGIQEAQENKQIQLQFNNENQGGNFAQNNQENINRESSSVSYVTQNIPFLVPQPYPVFVNHPVPQQVPVNIPKQEEQQYQVQLNNQYQVPVNQPAPELHSARVLQKQEMPVQLAQSYSAQTNQPQPQNLFAPDTNAQNQAQQDQSNDGQYFGNYVQNGKENDHDIQRKEINSKLYTSTGNQIVSHESEATANNGFVPSNFDLQKLQSSGHQFAHQNFQAPSQIGGHLLQRAYEGTPGFQQNFQVAQYQIPQQPSTAHSIFTDPRQGPQSSAQLNTQENVVHFQQNYQTNSALPNQYTYQLPNQQQQPLNGFIQNFQSKASPANNFQQSYQTNADIAALAGLAQGTQYNFQGLGQGQQTLGLQQSSHANEGQAQVQPAPSGYFPEAQKAGAFDQQQAVYSQAVGNGNNGNNQEAQQDLQKIHEFLLNRESANVGQQYLTGSNKHGANV